jgi:hypothetical protein
MDNNAYLHSIIRDLTDVLWEEHGTGAKYRTTLVGVDYFKEKYADSLVGVGVDETVEAVIDALKKEGLVDNALFERDEYALRVTFTACSHLEMEKQLLNKGINVINCPCANIIMHFVDKLVGKYSELVCVEVGKDKCSAVICVMKKTDS